MMFQPPKTKLPKTDGFLEKVTPALNMAIFDMLNFWSGVDPLKHSGIN